MFAVLLLMYHILSASCSEVLSRNRRAWIIDAFTIEEEHPGPFPYKLGTINIDQEYGVYFDLLGEGVDQKPVGVLSIHKESGMVYVHKPVDYEERSMLRLKLEATTKTDFTLDTALGVHISILDINDNAPRFVNDLYEIRVKEEEEQGSHVIIVWASDRDKEGTPNSTFHYEIKSVSPTIQDTEFFIHQSGEISFKGCLDYDAAEMFTILVEAKDHGEVVSLSSSTTVLVHVQDGNNHLPTISGQTGSGKVRENEFGTSPLRLHVTDQDSPNTAAWRARFSIQGDDADSFKIETDPLTNDGVLTVVKPLDFEDGAQRELLISVENDSPHFSCKVKEKTSTGLWKVHMSKADDPDAAQSHSVKVVIEIEDVNDPPIFNELVKKVTMVENSPIGTWVEKVTAVDHDFSHAKEFVYKVGHDPAGWVTVDPHKGDITTVSNLDRESPLVIDGIYTVLLHAVDNGNPPMTGTATLNIFVIDQNDNVPQLRENILDVCLADGVSTKDIVAFDRDEDPFGGPFTFELLGDVDGKWNLNPSHGRTSYGYTASLVTAPGVYAGEHIVELKVSDLQGKFGVYSLNVTVCDCSETLNCRSRRDATTTAAFGAVTIMFASLLLFLVLLLMAVFISCKKEFTNLQVDQASGETLLASNTEIPGTDCEVTVPDSFHHVSTDIKRQDVILRKSLPGMQHIQVQMQQENSINKNFEYGRNEKLSFLLHEDRNQTSWNSRGSYHYNQQTKDLGSGNFRNKRNSSSASYSALSSLLHRRLLSIQETEGEVVEDQPHSYAEEGDLDKHSELEDIVTPDWDSFQAALKDLGPKFNQLAAICRKSNR